MSLYDYEESKRAASLETWLLRSRRPALVRALVGNARHVEAWS